MRGLIIMLCCSVFLNIHAQKRYEKEWKQITSFTNEGLPASVITLSDKIYKDAQKEKNFPQQLRAFITRMDARLTIDTDSFYTDFAVLRNWKAQVNDSVQKSVLAQVIADQMIQYIQSDRYSILQKSDTRDDQETDIRKWSSAQFREECLLLNNESRACPEKLSLVPTKNYPRLVELGDASRYFLHDMYHLSGFHSIKVIQDLQRFSFLSNTEASQKQAAVYEEMLKFYTQKGNRSAVLLLNLERLKASLFTQALSDSLYRVRLDELIQTNQDLEVSVEVYLEKAQSLRNSGKYTEALSLIDQVTTRYTKYDRINAFKQLREEITRPMLIVELPRIAYPGEQIEIKVNHKSLKNFTLRFYPISLGVEQKELTKFREKNFIKEYGGTPFNREFKLDPPTDYHEKDTTFYIEAPTYGIYAAEIITTAKNETWDRLLLHVSSLKALIRKQPGDRKMDVLVLDRKSGNPVPDVELEVYDNQKGEYIYSKTLTTDSKGECKIEEQNTNFQIFPKKEKDHFLPGLYAYNYSNVFLSDETSNESLQILTDRGLYRPGQNIHVKGIAYRKLGDRTQVIPSRNYDLSLFDANDKLVSKVTLLTNEFGSFQHTFALPVRTLSGDFRIACEKSSATVRVEEYKRPTFELTFDTLKSAPQLGETVTITGKASTFSGFPLQNDSVNYTILREPRFPWRMSGSYSQIIASGSTSTNAQGLFSVTFNLEPSSPNNVNEQIFRFRVQVDVTESSGETQRGETTIIAGNRSLIISCDLPPEICRDSVLKVTPRAENLNGIPMPTMLNVKLFAKIGKQLIWSGTVKANETQTIRELDELASGEYTAELTTRDAQNRLIKLEQDFTLFSMKDTHSPVRRPIWSKQIHTVFPDKRPAEILFATAEKDIYLVYDLFASNQLVESKRIFLSDTLIHFRLPYKEEYGEGVAVNICFVKNGILYQESYTIQKPIPQKTLTLKWEVFRDKLQPGQKEEWRLSVKDPDGIASRAEIMASLYDASLDQIYRFSPNFRIDYSRYIPITTWDANNEYAGRNYVSFPFKDFKYPDWVYDHWSVAIDLSRRLLGGLRVNTMDFAVQGRIAGYGNSVKRSTSLKAMPSVPNNAMTVTADAAIGMQEESLKQDETILTEPPVSETKPIIRANFNETAFFYPQLRTDENGEISITFTLPETLTKWRFTGIAHTKDVKTGMLQSDITVSKPFMLTANLPRYLRQGDETGIAASIRNFSGERVQGEVRCELFDPSTNEVFRRIEQPFHLDNDSTLAVFFELQSMTDYEIIGVRMIADGGTFSDGEQHILALLSDKVHLTESVVLSQRGNGSKEYSLASLFNQQSPTASDRKITVEITSNPTWLAVQSLPFLNTPTGENAINFATAYYANTLSGWIVQQNPQLKAALEIWKSSPEPTPSNLQRNSELKELLLEETPWISQAESEAERRSRLVTLTDVNTLNYQRNEALQKLKDLQLADGSFPWFPGMRGSSSITNYILELLGRVPILTNDDEDPLSQTIRSNAYRYLHQEMTEHYNRIENQNNYKLSEWELNYLYLCSLSSENIPESAQKAYNFYLQSLRPSLTDLSIRGRATAVLVLLHANRTTEATAFYRSLKEHVVGDQEMGLFFANAGLFDETYTLTRATEAAWAMNEDAFADELKLNILRRKQTQMWESPVSTSNAIYALLRGTPNLSTETGESIVTLGNTTIKSHPKAGDADALMGYTKVSFTGQETKADRALFSHTGTGLSWGAIYGECMERIDQVKEQGISIKIEKELFVRRQTGDHTNGGVLWEKVSETTLLHRGDQVITRLTVTSDRDMDFVILKDQRAACLEPIQQLSGYRTGGYFVTEKDASSNLFFDRMPKGTHQFELKSYVTRNGTYNSGIATIQSAYATEFNGHSGSLTLTIQ